jgi:hypothetical protein
MDFFPCFGTYPSLPAVYRRMGEQCSSSSPQIQLQLKTSPVSEPQPPMAGTKHRLRDTSSFSTRPMDFFLCLAAYPSLAPKLCRSSNLAVVVQVQNGNAPTKTLAPETVQSCSDGVLWSNPHPAPSDCFPYARAPSLHGRCKSVCEIPHVSIVAQWTFSPDSSPTPPCQLHIAVWGSSAA